MSDLSQHIFKSNENPEHAGTVPARLVFIAIIALALMAFATGHIFLSRFPDGWKWLAILGVAMIEGGAIVWFHVWTRRSVDKNQQNLATAMFIACTIGSVITSLADAGHELGIFFLNADFIRIASYIVISVSSVANAVAWMFYDIWSPEHKARREKYIHDSELKARTDRINRLRESVAAGEKLLAEEEDLANREADLVSTRQRIEDVRRNALVIANDGKGKEPLPNK